MNLTELKKAVAAETGLKLVDADKAVKAFFGAITQQLGKGEGVTLVGFGSFGVSERAARKARNPRTGKEMQIPASKVVQFRVGKGLKDAVNPAPAKKK